MKPADKKTGSNAERTRSSNRQAVLGLIRTAQKMGRAEIARAVGLSTQAVSNIIADLETDGLLKDVGTRISGRGMPAVQYGINASGGYALGVEIRPDAIFTALVDLHGIAVASRRRRLTSNNPSILLRLATTLRNEMLEGAEIDAKDILGAGVVIPGPFGKTGLSGSGSALKGWEDLEVRALFETALEVPVEVNNDANAAALSERLSQGLMNFAYLYFGAGLGLGLVNNGQLVTGAFGNAGEIGHIQVSGPQGRLPLESQLSRVSLHDVMPEGTSLNITAIDQLYCNNFPELMEWLSPASHALSEAIALIENLFDPETVILGGAMPKTVLNHLITKTKLSSSSVSNRPDRSLPRLQCGTSGRLTATLGAASLILNRVFTPQAAAL